MKKFSDYYENEDEARNLSILSVDDVFYRAFDDGATELELAPKEYRLLYVFGQSNGLLTISDSGIYVFGVKLKKVV